MRARGESPGRGRREKWREKNKQLKQSVTRAVVSVSSREQPEPVLEGLGQRLSGAQAPRNYTLDPEPGLRSGRLCEQAVKVVFKFYLQLSDTCWVLGTGIVLPLRGAPDSNPKSHQETGHIVPTAPSRQITVGGGLGLSRPWARPRGVHRETY